MRYRADICSFCGTREDKTSGLVRGPAVNICSECIDYCLEILEELDDESERELSSGGELPACSFCSQPRALDRFIIAGPDGFICEHCVQDCRRAVREKQAR